MLCFVTMFLGFFLKKNMLMPYLTEKKIRFCIVAEKKFLLSPARKKKIVLLNLSS